MTVDIQITYNPTGEEALDYLSQQFQEAVKNYNRAVEIGDYKGTVIYFSKASLLQELLIDLFGAHVADWYE